PVNALSQALVADLAALATELARDDDSSVVVFRSALEHFCAGADLKERKTIPPDQVAGVVTSIRDCFDSIARLPQITIAAVNGTALGGGAELVLACDLRVMATDVRFGLTETTLGIIPGGGGTQRLSRLVGTAKALELIAGARVIDGAECLKLGIANRVATSGDLATVADEWAQVITRQAPLALRAAKLAVLEGWELPLSKALEVERAAYDSLINTADREEGLRAFTEKRPPVWRGE
ncbi:MAG: enoyl-CoA hydratase-related protein, partial [Candidatus Neomarinimicrobiota bacterium]